MTKILLCRKCVNRSLYLKDVPKVFPADREIVPAACLQNCRALLQYASPELKAADKEVALSACHEHGSMLKYAAEELSVDKDVVLEACRQNNGLALCLPTAGLLQEADKEMVMAAFQQNGWALKFCTAELRANKEVVWH
jgi:hypothetical protein